jgi:hypothetical protein
MIHCCICPYADEASIAKHILDEHNVTLVEYCSMFPEMPVGSLEGVSATMPVRVIRRSKIVRHWWPVATALIMVWNGARIRDLEGNIVTGKVVETRQFLSGLAIQDTRTGDLYSSPTGWVRVRAPWISSPNGWKIVNPISKKES